jgi:DNA polymerase III epsilon subunit
MMAGRKRIGPMREIIFDTETTGLDSSSDRIIEIGAVELENRFVTGRNFHVYINPDGKEVHPEALAVHGISNEQLEDKPKFKDVVQDWFDFTAGAKLIAHNANFDVGFFNAEFARLGFPPIDPDLVIDSLSLARKKHPMGPNSLDALCRAMRSTIRSAKSTAPCSTANCWRKSISSWSAASRRVSAWKSSKIGISPRMPTSKRQAG